MLKSIRIRNFAIVEEISIDFADGFNLITGETGAGKSLIVDALEVLLGERSSASLVRTGEKKATIEGVFACVKVPEIEALFGKAGIPLSEELILKREIGTAGGGKIYINDEMVNASTLKLVGNLLVDIHGQHQHQSLLNPLNHLALIDRFGDNEKYLQEVSDVAALLAGSVKEFEKLKEEMTESERKIEFLDFQVTEIERLSPVPGEDESLAREVEILRNAEMLRSLASQAYGNLYEDEKSLLHLLKQVRMNLERLSSIDAEISKFVPQLDDAKYSLEDLSLFLRDYLKKLDFNPGRLGEVGDRIAEIDRLKGKHGGTIEKVLAFKSKAKNELERLRTSDERVEQLRGEIDDLYGRYSKAAEVLSRKRHEDGKRFSKKVLDELRGIAMEKCRFKVDIETLALPRSHDAQAAVPLSPSGIDRGEFLISMNVGEDLRPLSRVASGGELSRIMLAINAVMKHNDDIRTLIFDEVDAGIGAGVASRVGQKLKLLSKRNQVLCITHLPQIASLADRHLKAVKEVAGGRTVVHVEAVEGKEKVREIARMLAGEKMSDASLRHAEEMIKNEKRELQKTQGSLPGNI